MAHKDQNRVDAARQQENDTIGRDFDRGLGRNLDRDLDIVLAKYAAVEPRAGLEERILASLRVEGTRVPDRAWWRWSVIAAVAAVVVVALALASRSGKPSHPVIASHPSTTTQGTQEPATQAASNGGSKQVRPPEPNAPRKIAAPGANPAVVASAAPKLDQFPSPQPLSEQEKLLENYVAKYPERAVLLARARFEALQRDQLEEINAFPSRDRTADLNERNNDTTER
jgi:hypothetical protein